MKLTKVLLFLIIISIIYLSVSVNGAFVINDVQALVDAYKNNNLIRLHVIANSNSPKDQYIKRMVRDEINKMMSELNHDSLKLNQKLTDKQLINIEKTVNGFLRENRVNYSADVNFNNYYFPKRTYGDLSLPAGNYKALKIKLGQGEGANWWCVLLPPLCIEKEQENIDSNKEKIEVKLKLVELLKSTDINQFVNNSFVLAFKKLNINFLKPEMED